MKVIQIDLKEDYSDAIQEAIKVMHWGGVIVYPTDTLYGLGANALNEIGVKKVFGIKNRSYSKPLPIIVKNLNWIKELAITNSDQEKIFKKIWPGKVTAILAKKSIIPSVLTGNSNSVGIRIPDHEFTDKLLGKYGYPITSTSANITNQEPTNDVNKIVEIFSSRSMKPDLVIDAGILPKSNPSMVIDLTTKKHKILRVGPSRPDQFLKLLDL